jgi:hypothetical protein
VLRTVHDDLTDLAAYLNHPSNGGLRDTIVAAQAHGVHVQGLGGWPTLRQADLGPGMMHGRAVMFNAYGTQAVQTHQASLGADAGKYIIDAGTAHGYGHTFGDPVSVKGVPPPQTMPGMGDILNIPVIHTCPTNPTAFEAITGGTQPTADQSCLITPRP